MLHEAAGQRVFSPPGLFSFLVFVLLKDRFLMARHPPPVVTVRRRTGVVMARLWHGILGDPPGNCPADGSRLDTLDRTERPTRHPTRSQTSSLLWHGLGMCVRPSILAPESRRH